MKYIPNSLTNKFGRQMLILQKNSPHILFGAGVVGVIGGTVLACRATLKVDEVLDAAQAKLSDIREVDHKDYSEQDRKKDRTIVLVKAGMDVAKLYAPAIAITTVSICALTKSHTILTGRNAALTAAYAAIEKSFSDYRERVEKELGPEKEREIARNGEVKTVEDEAGKPRKTQVVNPNGHSQYARFFDQTCGSWSKTPEYNMAFLHAQQTYMNNMLQARGHVFLNEVYDALGIPRSKAGSVVGWILSKNGDNFVDFGIFNGSSEAVRSFVNGDEGAILLDFNVDGVIYDKID